MWARDIVDGRDYGPKLEYDPQWKGPLQTGREKTDVGFLIALIVYLFIWIGVGIYAFCTGDMQSLFEDFHLDYFSSISSEVIFVTLVFTVFGICLSFTFLILLRYFPRAVFFTSILFNIVLFVPMLSYVVYIIMLSEQIGDEEIGDKITFLPVLLMSILLAVPIVVCVILFRRKIFIACEVVKESTKAVLFFPSSFLFPILPFILCILTVAFTSCTWACLYENSSTQNGDRPLHLYVLHGINFFGFWWIMNFILAFSQMVLGGTFATWYWTIDRHQIPNYVILKFMYIVTRFHLGTMAFGSLIIALIEAVKYLLNSGAQRSASRGDAASSGAFSCFHSLCGLSGAFLEYINTNAYTMCIMHGAPFIQSAKDAFYLLKRNIMKVFAVNCVTGTVLGMAAIATILLSLLATIAYCRNMESTVIVIASSIVLFTTLLTSLAIFSVVGIAINTIFLCVLEDGERNNGSSERPYFMTPEMRQLLMRDAYGRPFNV